MAGAGDRGAIRRAPRARPRDCRPIPCSHGAVSPCSVGLYSEIVGQAHRLPSPSLSSDDQGAADDG